jgi:hypothetical protein
VPDFKQRMSGVFPSARISESIGWVVESEGVRLLDSADPQLLSIPYPEAAVWDLLSRRYTKSSMVSLMAVIGQMSEVEAEELIDRCVLDWRQRGYLKPL